MGMGQDRMEMGLPRVGWGQDKLRQPQAGMQEEAHLHHSVPVPMGWDRGLPLPPQCRCSPRAAPLARALGLILTLERGQAGPDFPRRDLSQPLPLLLPAPRWGDAREGCSAPCPLHGAPPGAAASPQTSQGSGEGFNRRFY